MTFEKSSFLWIVVLLGLGLAAALAGFVELSLEGLSLSDLGTKFLTLIFIALVIERAVEVYINNRFSEREMKARRGIRLAQQRLLLEQQAQEAQRSASVAFVAVPEVVDRLAVALEASADTVARFRDQVMQQRTLAQEPLEIIRTEKTRTAGRISLILSFGAALVGVRVLGLFLPEGYSGLATGTAAVDVETASAEIATTLHYNQLIALRTYDAVLTALLLAGGADGIHQIMKDFLIKRDELIPT